MSLYIFNITLIFFLPTLPSINTPTFLSRNFQFNFKFVFFLGNLVKVLRLMIISFNFLICEQLAKTTLILKPMKYNSRNTHHQLVKPFFIYFLNKVKPFILIFSIVLMKYVTSILSKGFSKKHFL